MHYVKNILQNGMYPLKNIDCTNIRIVYMTVKCGTVWSILVKCFLLCIQAELHNPSVELRIIRLKSMA